MLHCVHITVHHAVWRDVDMETELNTCCWEQNMMGVVKVTVSTMEVWNQRKHGGMGARCCFNLMNIPIWTSKSWYSSDNQDSKKERQGKLLLSFFFHRRKGSSSCNAAQVDN